LTFFSSHFFPFRPQKRRKNFHVNFLDALKLSVLIKRGLFESRGRCKWGRRRGHLSQLMND
jgi:hypothetical protein